MNNFYKNLVAILLVGSAINLAQAETQYVSENLQTYLRRGAGDNYKIAGTIKAGEPVSVLEKQGKYSLIRDSKNREAWILTAELSQHPSAKLENSQLKAKVEDLTLKLNRLDENWQQQTNAIQHRIKQTEQQNAELLTQNAQIKRELEISHNKNRDLETLLDSKKREIAIQWFFCGGSVLAVGLILGLLISKLFSSCKRKPKGWA